MQSPPHLHAFEGGAPPGFRQRPHNIEAEQGLLGAIMINNEAYRAVSGFLQPTHFYEPVHGRIFASARRLIDAGRLADPTTLKLAFDEDEALRELNGSQYLVAMARAAESILNAADYGKVIVELAGKRALIEAVEAAANEAYDARDGRSIADLLTHLRGDIERITKEVEQDDDDDLLMLDDCVLERDAFWLIDDVLPRANMMLIYGRGGCGKTYLATSLTLGFASGTWFNHKAEPGAALYCAFERPEDAEDRLAALRAKFGFKALPVALKKLGGKALDEGLTEKIIRWARKLAETTGKPCRSIIMDTVAAALGGRKEDDEGLGRLRVLGERIHAETGATIVWVHHEGKSENMGPRGHTTLFDACSIWWHLEERESGDRVVHVAKANRGPCYEPLFSFKLASFDAGKDNRGKSINLCAVELSDLDEALASKPRVRFGPKKEENPEAGLGSRQKILLRALRKLTDRNPDGIDRKTLRSHFILDLNCERKRQGEGELKGEMANTAFRQALSKCKGHIVHDDGLLRPTV
jgi:hypothetical protein